MGPQVVDLPKLRFPGFDDPWTAQKIDDLIVRCVKPVTVEPGADYSQIGIRSHGRGIFHKNAVSGSSLGNKRVYWIEPDCFVLNIVFAWEQALSKTTESEIGMIASHRFPMYKARKQQSNIDFILRLFLRPRGKHLLGLASPGGAGRNRTLGQSDFLKLKVKVPTVSEQNVIADFLGSIDTRIQQLTRRRMLLDRWKTGLMQQIFSQQLRFKDGDNRDFPNWEEKKLSQVAQINPRAQSLPKNFLYIDLGSVKAGRLDKPQSLEVDEAPSRAKRALEKGDILFQVVRPYQMNNLFFELDGNYVASTGYAQLRVVNHHPKFIYYSVHAPEFVRTVVRRCTGMGYPAINSSDLASISIPLPSTVEQEKIADFLSSVDARIDAVGQQIDNTMAFKQGLLQQLFV